MRLRHVYVPFVVVLVAVLAVHLRYARRDTLRIRVLHTNDLHGQVQPRNWRNPETEEVERRGGLACIAAMIRDERAWAEAGEYGLLYLDAGDQWQGTPEGKLTHGAVMAAWLAHVGVVATALGNHEFDDGDAARLRLAETARYPYLAANLETAGTGDLAPGVRPFLVHEVRGVRVGIGGITTSSTPEQTVRGATGDLRFGDEVATARRLVADLEAAGAEVVILLTHVGVEMDWRIAREVEGIDLIVGGHSHTPLDEPLPDPETGTLVVQAGSKGAFLGVADLEVDLETREVTGRAGRLLPVRSEAVEPDAGTAALLGSFTAKIDERMTEVVGRTSAAVTQQNLGGSTPMGNLMTDIMREVTGARIALHNRAGMRGELPAGEVTMRDLYQVCPFDNSIVAMDLRGAQVLALLARSIEEGRLSIDVSGLEAEVMVAAEGEPGALGWVRLLPEGEPLDPAGTYRVATNSFLSGGGDGYTVFTEGTAVEDTGLGLREALGAHLRDRSPVEPPIVPRLRVTVLESAR